MEEKKDNNVNEPKDIESLLALKKEVDEQIEKEYSKDVVVMLTDIYESTSFFESRGDLEGRLMIQKHNDILFPIIGNFSGKVIKTIGDAIMASFDDAGKSVRCSIAMQQALYEFNRDKKEKDQINIRIGINKGKGIVEKKDIYGDVVNTVARIEKLTEPDQILISDEVYKVIKNSEEIICRFSSHSKVKGKEEELELYRVVWTDEEILTSKTRVAPDKKKPLGKSGDEIVFVIEISKGGNKLKTSSYEKTHSSVITVRHYEELAYDEADIDSSCKEIINLLNKTNKQGKLSKEILLKLRECGQFLYDHLFTLETKKKLATTKGKSLLLSINDDLVHIPWELLYDGNDFLCLKFNMGRVVSTRHDVSDLKIRKVERPLKILILADPKGDLKASYEEGINLKNLFYKEDLINDTFRSNQIQTNYVKQKIRNFDIVHYAGHSDYDRDNPANSGWLLTDGKLKSSDLLHMRGSSPFPALIFSNACYSGMMDEWKIDEKYEQKVYGMANVFLLSGVQHYIGTFWEVMDESSSKFAVNFYKELINGKSIGEAVRNARQSLIKLYGEDQIVWASYMLYGDPDFRYIESEEIEAITESSKEGEEAEKKSMITDASRRSAVGKVSNYFRETAQAKIIFGLAVLLIIGFIFSTQFINPKKEEVQIPSPVTPSGKVSNEYIEFSNKAVRLEKEGKLKEAITYYKKAVGANPNDALSKTLMANAGKKLRLTADIEKNKRIDSLINDLVARYKEGKKKGTLPKAGDSWSSKPVITTFFDFESKGDKPQRAGISDFLLISITNALQEDGRIKVVEREALDKLLSELKLSQTELADKNTALRVGKILSAKLISIGSIVSYGDEIQVNIRMIDTETSSIKASFAEIFNIKDSLNGIAGKLSEKIIKKVSREFPLKGKITGAEGSDNLTVNIGIEQGVKEGMLMKVLNNKSLEAGKVQIIEVFDKSSIAKVLSGNNIIKKGMKVQELSS